MKFHPILLSQIFNKPMLATPELMLDAVVFSQTHLGLVLAGAPKMGSRLAAVDNDEDDDAIDDDYDGDGSGVAQIAIHGPLVSRTGNLRMCQTMTAYESINSQLSEALADPSVNRIILDIDSPGGDATGAFECAANIRAAHLVKPVTAIVNFKSFSGGYLLASAAGDISVSQSSGVGSIGVIAKHIDVSKMNENLGVSVTTVYRGARKNDLSPDEPLSDGAKNWLDGHIGTVYDQFTNAVSGYRNIPLQQVVNTEAGVFFGQAAIDAGLADRLETPQQAFDRVVKAAKSDASAATKPQSQPLFSANRQRLQIAAQAMAMQAAL